MRGKEVTQQLSPEECLSKEKTTYLKRREQVMLRRMASWKGIPSQPESFYAAQSQHTMSQNASHFLAACY